MLFQSPRGDGAPDQSQDATEDVERIDCPIFPDLEMNLGVSKLPSSERGGFFIKKTIFLT